MNQPDEENDDLVERAIDALRTTSGTDHPPDRIVEAIRQRIRERVAASRGTHVFRPRLRDQVASWPLASCVALIVLCGWLVGFHESIFRREAGRQIAPDGTVSIYYSDGQVVASHED
jgi:hypothetical protein